LVTSKQRSRSDLEIIFYERGRGIIGQDCRGRCWEGELGAKRMGAMRQFTFCIAGTLEDDEKGLTKGLSSSIVMIVGRILVS
jgi:hypothetical protein